MSWRFRQSFTVVPGLRLNLSKSGLSASIGGAPLTVNVGPYGVMGTASIPGTGLSYRHHLSSPSAERSNGGSAPPLVLPTQGPSQLFINAAPIEEVHSASTELLTSETLKQIKQLIQSAYQQHQEVSRELDSARTAKVEWESKYQSWENGVLLKKLFKKAFAKRRENFETETARVSELEEQQRLSTISTYIEVDADQAELYFRLRDEFAALSDCAAIWDVKSHQANDKFHQRTVADTSIGRERVRFELGNCDLISWEQQIAHLRNAKGGELYLYPGFILYRAAREAFSLIVYHDVSGKACFVGFHEEDGVPADSEVIGRTWKRANKDGSRDKRFADNFEIPIARYGMLTLKTDSGLWEEFHFSKPDRMVNFLIAFNTFTASFAAIEK
jgi:hypothetical protein